ncbi:MAG: anaerobic sulfatase maturase [Tepidisphaeraceae bacterium]
MSYSNLPVASARRPFHVMTKPIGPKCNIGCSYCFYLEKEKLYPDERKWAMPENVLEEYVRQYIAAQPQGTPVVPFAWQGGEPTLLGVSYFRKVVELQKKHAGGRAIENAFQTNGTLLDREWGEFLAENKFLVGLSIDGPRELHDALRVDKKGRPTFDNVMRGLRVLHDHKVEFNTLTVVNRVNSQKPREVYRFLKEIGSGFIQLIPLVERQAQVRLKVFGLDLAEPTTLGDRERPPVTDWSVRADDYGTFLCSIFDEWVCNDVGKVFVQIFDVALGNWVGAPPSLCVFAPKCGSALAMEHNGDLYSCDHYVYPQYRLGNVMNQSLGAMVDSAAQKKFGGDKSDLLPDYCRRCDVRFACHGECPKHRFVITPDGQPGLNYLCAGYKMFFTHISPAMQVMTQLLNQQRAPAEIMHMIAQSKKT